MLAAVAALGGCRNVATSFGPSPRAARANAEGLFGSLAARFTSVARTEGSRRVRQKLAQSALAPGALFDDPSLWSAVTADGTRQLTMGGRVVDDHYVLAVEPVVRPPEQLAESRHVIRLRRLGNGEFEWQTAVENAVGSIRAADVASVFRALIESAEGRDERGLRGEYRDVFPRSTRALGRLLALDTLRAAPAGDGTTALTLGFSIHPEWIQPAFPHYAKYIDKYARKGKLRLSLRDRRGAPWMELDARDNLVVLRLRARSGQLAPLSGAVEPMPDSMRLHVDAFEHFLFFDVGVTSLIGELTVVRGEHERAWSLRFDREPDWHLPLAVAHLIRSPLRRPFEREGVALRIGVHDAMAPQTVLYRHLRFAVRESAIVRWLGHLGATAANDFEGDAEVEENRFNSEIFRALRADVASLLGAE